jgi:hypothetical protein
MHDFRALHALRPFWRIISNFLSLPKARTLRGGFRAYGVLPDPSGWCIPMNSLRSQ